MFPQLPSSMCRITNILLILLIASIRTTLFAAGDALQPVPQHHHGGGCIPAERSALLSFKKGITNDSINLLRSWHGQDCCSWSGVECSNQTGHVIKLQLRNPNPDMHGSRHYINCLYGEISSSLISLKQLEYMDLSMHNLQGPYSHMPHFLGSFENLRYLNISGIAFTGRVPPQLGNLSKLQYLDLGSSFGFEMYSTDITWLTKLRSLQYLSLTGVNLSTIHDWPHTMNMISSLRVISLQGCSLNSTSQSLPHFNLTKLDKLDLSVNYLEDSIASSWFWKATGLKYLGLSYNGLLGQFPDALENMTSLQVLDLSWNNLNKTRNFRNLCSLEILDLSYNQINGDVTDWLPKCKIHKLQELHFAFNSFTLSLINFIGEFTSLKILELFGNQLVGPIPPGLGNLKCLTTLDLSLNQLVGPIPPGLGNLKCLTTLDLSLNQLVGPIPAEIGALTSITNLHIHNNNLTGSIPTELGKLRYLTELYLSNNKLVGSIPPEVMHLTSLVMLDLGSNQLSGSLPSEIQVLTSLVSLDISHNNHLNGSVPTEIGSLPSLKYLDLSHNNFSGVITKEHLAGLKSLKSIDLSFNNVNLVVDSDWIPPFKLEFAGLRSCQLGPLFPAWLRQLENTALDISSNGLKGEIPDWFWSTFSRAGYLSIANNQLSGSLPSNLNDMDFDELLLGSNMLTGPIPSLPTNISVLDISKNSFSGNLPSDIGAQKLQVLLMYSNRIGGYIPESLCASQNLLYLDLSNNFLEGETLHCFSMQNIHFLLLSNNSLSGKFPAILQNSTSLEFLDLAWNQFSGTVPAWIGELRSLRFLLLGHNTFSGNIPYQITNLSYLQYLDLSSNKFFGVIPWSLSNLSSMTKFPENLMVMDEGLIENNLTAGPGNHLGEIFLIFTKGQQLIYGQTLAYFVSIDLSDNFLVGEIPTDITSLASLMNLNLASNRLSGEIPTMIGTMQSLVSLDLSKNKFSGEIPSSLSNLSSLSYLNLSYNNLSGRIPSGRQLDTLNADNPSVMYIGNSGLCGPPLQNNCSGNTTVIYDHLSGSEEGFEPLTFYFGLMLGLVAGHWVVFAALLFNKTWRISYFRIFDKMYDKIYVFVVLNWAYLSRNTTAEGAISSKDPTTELQQIE